ncbi:sensor histidine kinase [Noviherbaspirillum saxi]|uniref:histidine kinase n=1 Tax=Noviherbaspirillum saxi TaxID=2320863 RepID=A0A3A3FF99_9BURK|nr:sensor histidine kinase [Noviherbaspirillum saxi]RJF92011.1 sensor histidine kinase [Noviherbaspirillum saxi]
MTASIRSDLLKWLIAPLVVINLIGALLIYMLAWAPAQDALDQKLAEAVYDMRAHLKVVDGTVRLDFSDQADRMLRFNLTDSVFYAVRNQSGKLIAGDPDFPSFLVYGGKNNEVIAYMGNLREYHIRIVAMKTVVGTEAVWIGAAETLSARRQIQSRILLALLGLEALLVVASLAIVWFAVTEGLFPLQTMRKRLDTRNANDLSPTEEEGMPAELRPLARAINGLLARAQEDSRARQSFLADIAHQLRTPLAGISAQLELLQSGQRLTAEMEQSTRLISSSVERMIRQTNQLLSLARAEPAQFESKRLAPVEIDKLVTESIQHFVQEADKKRIDIGFDLQPARVMGDRFLLRDLVDNLVDNAIRYSFVDGRITVRCLEIAGDVHLIVEDSGPGIALEDREKVFQRFVRLDDKINGTGLGLAIVHDIAVAHHARIELDTGPDGKGVRFAVCFPAA